MAYEINNVIGKTGRLYKENNEIINEANIMEATIGVNSLALTGTNLITAPTGYYIFCIIPSSAMVVASQVNKAGAINAVLSSVTSHPASTPIYTNLTAITLTSGNGIAYLMEV